MEDWNNPSHIPPGPEDPEAPNAIWVHNNNSDSYSANANAAIHIEDGWTGGNVVRIDTIAGQGDTENGTSKAADASVLTLIDIGDPRTGGRIIDPSDRKLYLQHVMTGEGGAAIEMPYDMTGITLMGRIRVWAPDLTTPYKAGANFANLPHDTNGDKPQVSFGYYDFMNVAYSLDLGVSFFSADGLNLCENNLAPVIKSGINTTQFHSFWMNAQVLNPEDPWTVHVKVWMDGSATPNLETDIDRTKAGNSVDYEGDNWAEQTLSMVSIGSQGTGDHLAIQVDYVCANAFHALRPTPATSASNVDNWTLY